MMTAQKRGLGRGLEALLVDVSTKEQEDDSLIAAITLIKALQAERANLLKEVEVLQLLLEDFESLVRNLKIDNY